MMSFGPQNWTTSINQHTIKTIREKGAPPIMRMSGEEKDRMCEKVLSSEAKVHVRSSSRRPRPHRSPVNVVVIAAAVVVVVVAIVDAIIVVVVFRAHQSNSKADRVSNATQTSVKGDHHPGWTIG